MKILIHEKNNIVIIYADDIPLSPFTVQKTKGSEDNFKMPSNYGV